MEKIPHVEDPARYERREFHDSVFVKIVPDDRIDVQMQYPILGMKHAEQQCLLRKEAAERLYKAAEKLPAGFRFRIWDAWRPFALQHELYETYSKDIIKDFHLENSSREEREAVIRGFVSDPISDREIPPVHTTGGAVDLTILGEDGMELEMGTGFDAFTDKTRTDFFEQDLTWQGTESIWQIRENRRLLYGVMTSAGFTNLPSEWWHYDFGDRFWAYYNGKASIYRGVFTKEELRSNGETGRRKEDQ